MCGIVGIINFNKKSINRELLSSMNNLVSYRGPDGEGYCFDDNNGVGFGHRRLSILDLSDNGLQPMSYCNEEYWIVFNGEIYNYIEIKEELTSKGYSFKNKTDTEVILGAYKEWGESCVEKFNGMWAFAIWDKNSKKLFCSRDRFGVKPFYYFYNGKVFVFASEIKQILLHPDYVFGVNKKVIYDYIAFSIMNHTEETFHKNINQLIGSHSLTLDLNEDNPVPVIKKYWDIDISHKDKNSGKNYKKVFYNRFYDSIKLRLRSDVPIASCLSGGLDSSSIVCMVNKQLRETGNDFVQEAFSARNRERRFDESNYVREVEKKLDIKCHYTFPDPQNFIKDAEKIVFHMDGPIISGSIYNQYCVFKLAHENNFKVMLDGQGSDEYLAGYHHFFNPYLKHLLDSKKWITFLKEIVSLKIKGLLTFKQFVSFMNSHSNINNPLTYGWLSPNLLKECENSYKYRYKNFKDILYQYLMYRSVPKLLHYEDRNSMAFSIESRVPFLDYKLVEYVFSLSDDYKIRNGITKFVLREGLKSILPSKIYKRRDKLGFAASEVFLIYHCFSDYLLENLDTISELDIFNIEELKTHIKDRNINVSNLWLVLGMVIWYNQTKDFCAKNKAYEIEEVF